MKPFRKLEKSLVKYFEQYGAGCVDLFPSNESRVTFVTPRFDLTVWERNGKVQVCQDFGRGRPVYLTYDFTDSWLESDIKALLQG